MPDLKKFFTELGTKLSPFIDPAKKTEFEQTLNSVAIPADEPGGNLDAIKDPAVKEALTTINKTITGFTGSLSNIEKLFTEDKQARDANATKQKTADEAAQKQKVTDAVTKYMAAGKLNEAGKDTAIALATANYEAFVKQMDAAPVIPGFKAKSSTTDKKEEKVDAVKPVVGPLGSVNPALLEAVTKSLPRE